MVKIFQRFLFKKFNIAIMIIAVILVTFFISKNINKAIPVISDKTFIDVKVIEENLRTIAELSTLTYTYSDVGIFSDQKTLSMFGNEIGIIGTKKSFIITYDGEMKFGIDLSKVFISENGDVLTITIPEVQMFSHEIKEDSISLLDEKTGLFTSSSVKDYADFMVQQKDKMENRALEKNFYSQAKLNAELQIKSFINAIPGVSEEYRIRFVD